MSILSKTRTPSTYFLKAKDVMILQQVKKSQAYNYLQLVRDALGKKTLKGNLHQVITLEEYCAYWSLDLPSSVAALNQYGAGIQLTK